jgi:hypothetical protein
MNSKIIVVFRQWVGTYQKLRVILQKGFVHHLLQLKQGIQQVGFQFAEKFFVVVDS